MRALASGRPASFVSPPRYTVLLLLFRTPAVTYSNAVVTTHTGVRTTTNLAGTVLFRIVF